MDIARKIKEIVLMDCTIYIKYNENKPSKAENNIKQDVNASMLLFNSGKPIYMMGFDVITMVKTHRTIG